MSFLTRKGYGRIYVDSVDDIAKVKEIIREIDAYEYDMYLPSNLIAPFSEYPAVVYTHKFCDIDMDALTAICWKRGVKVFVLDAGNREYIEDATRREE